MRGTLPTRVRWTVMCWVVLSMILLAGCAGRRTLSMPGVYHQLREERAVPSGYVRPPDEFEAPATAENEAGTAGEAEESQPDGHGHMHHGEMK